MSHEDKNTVWFVENGVMSSAWELGRITIDIDAEDDYYAFAMCEHLFNTALVKSSIPENGTYVILAGMSIVREEELFDTKEEAAEAFHQKLLM